MRAEEKSLPGAQVHVGFRQLRASGTHRLDFPALQHQACLVALFDEIFEARLAVLGDNAGCGVGLCHGRSGHWGGDCTCKTACRRAVALGRIRTCGK